MQGGELGAAWSRYAGLLDRGIAEASWRVPPSGVTLPGGMLRQLERLGQLMDRVLTGLASRLLRSPAMQAALGFPDCPEEQLLAAEHARDLLGFFKLDVALDERERPFVHDLDIVLSTLGIAQVLRETYGPNPALPGVGAVYSECVRATYGRWCDRRGRTPSPSPTILAPVLRKKVWGNDFPCLARGAAGELVSCDLADLPWPAFVLPDGRSFDVLHRTFPSRGFFAGAPFRSRQILRADLEGQFCLVNPWNDVLADKRLFALLHDLDGRRELEDVLSGEEWSELLSMIPGTWLATESAISRVRGQSRQRRRCYLKPARGFGARDVFSGDSMNGGRWHEACDRAVREGGWILQEAVRAPPRSFRYLDARTNEVREMAGYLRITPHYFRALDGSMRLGEVLITARDHKNRVHGASDALMCVAAP
jgi:hypothetical protein